MTVDPDSIHREARRRFLLKCGRFAVVTPPAMAMLLSVGAMPRQAQAGSGFRGWDDYDDNDNNDEQHGEG